MQEGVRDGAQGDVVHTMQMEESLHQVRRGGLKFGANLDTIIVRLANKNILYTLYTKFLYRDY